jgi:ABC-type polar amino acid transport system ATPase subunit
MDYSVPSLACHALEKYLGDGEARVHVLRGVSLAVRPGEIHAVVGPSGCGKSSLLYVLGLLDRPDGGSMSIEGDEISAMSDDRLSERRNESLGFIFQFHFLLQDFTALENVVIPMRRLGFWSEEEMESRARALLDAVGLANKAERSSRALSGGEQQRVAIARALAMKPRLMLFDEITSALNPELVGEVVKVLERLATSGMTMVLVTHEMGFARHTADTLVFMHQGKVWEKGPPRELFAAPKTRELESFIRAVLEPEA